MQSDSKFVEQLAKRNQKILRLNIGFDKKSQRDGFVHFVGYTIVKVSQQSNMYRTVDMKIRVISTLLNL